MATGKAMLRDDGDDLVSMIADVSACLRRGEAVRLDFGKGGRLHIDRPLPFLCLHVAAGTGRLAARDVAVANASYLLAPRRADAVAIVNAVGSIMAERYGSFIVLDVGELDHDILLADDSPYLPRFEVSVEATPEEATQAAKEVFIQGVCDAEALFRTPHITAPEDEDTGPLAALLRAGLNFPCISVRYAPIYQKPESGENYPGLRERLIGNIFDAGLRAFHAFAKRCAALKVPSHRALGRKAFVDAVTRADRSIDDIAASFDFLLAVTPINTRQAFREFSESGFERPPLFLYRPLAVDVEAQKRRLYSVSFEHLEDPVLYQLYREKQQEVDLQLTMLHAMNKPAFTGLSLALYGPLEERLKIAAREILAGCEPADPTASLAMADCYEVAKQARMMIERYQAVYSGFKAQVEIRDDTPAGLMVTASRLLVSRATVMERRRIDALLSHEIGVHLLTFFNGSAQGLRLFRTGLSGYEGVQEGLAVLAEYLAGGMTRERLRLIAGRVVACEAMLGGAGLVDTFRLLTRDYGFDNAVAFGVVLRIWRGGGLSKDAIYLRGLDEVVRHLRAGGSLDPFWMGKIAAAHFPVMQELASRGLLRMPSVYPAFLNSDSAGDRLNRIRAGMPLVDMATL